MEILTVIRHRTLGAESAGTAGDFGAESSLRCARRISAAREISRIVWTRGPGWSSSGEGEPTTEFTGIPIRTDRQSTGREVVREVLDHLKATEGYSPDVVVLLARDSATSPGELDAAIREFRRTGGDSVVSVSSVGGRIWRLGSTGFGTPVTASGAADGEHGPFVETEDFRVYRSAAILSEDQRRDREERTMLFACDRADVVSSGANLSDLLPDSVVAFVSDFDGVFTDDLVHVSSDGRETVTCSRSDGFGIERLRARELPMLVLSREPNPVVRARCEKLKLPVLHDVSDKWPVLRRWLADRNLEPECVVYVGNDITDIECLQAVGCGVAPADAHIEARRVAQIVLSRRGGHGAIREIADAILERLDAS